MGYYSGNMKLEFDGTNCEKTMMEKLLQLMEPGSDWKWTLPVDQDYDFFPATALLGLLKKRDDGKYCISGVPEYTFAPKLFAALFPATRFRYSIVLEYSVTLDDTPYLTAVYENNELMMRDSILYNYGDEEKIAEICKRIIETDSEAREKYEQYLKDTTSEDYEDVDWLLLLENLVDDPSETMASLYDCRIETPSRNKKYERSFFKDGDIQEYLVCEQIKTRDMSIGEYIQQFTFTGELLQKFLKTAEESNFTDLSVLMP